MIKIYCNNVARPVKSVFELTEKERKVYNDYHDYLSEQEQEEDSIVTYKNNVYSLSDFMQLDNDYPDLKGWHGIINDTFFSGILIKFTDDSDYVILATFYAS